MNSIESMAQDIGRQLVDLPAMPLPKTSQGKTILVGSGDSYVAALFAHYLSAGRVLCHHPTDIISDQVVARGSRAYFISTSGKTKANVLAAWSARKAGATSIAVTTDLASPLVSACNSAFKLKFKSAAKTSGTISFTASLLACARIASNSTFPEDLKSIYNAAKRRATSIADKVRTRNIVALGNSILHPAAVYCALKFNEVLGSNASAYSLEDFCHAPLFGHRKDQVIIFGVGDGTRVSRRLKIAGLDTLYVDCGKYDGLGAMFYATFVIQHVVLAIARMDKREECYFLQDKKLLDASSDIIY